MSKDISRDMSKQFVMYPVDVICASDLNSYEKTIYGVLCKYYNLKTKHCSPTISDLMKETGFDEKTLLKYLNLLFQKGYILIIRKKQKNYYRIAWFETNREKVIFDKYKVSAMYREHKRIHKIFKEKLLATKKSKEEKNIEKQGEIEKQPETVVYHFEKIKECLGN